MAMEKVVSGDNQTIFQPQNRDSSIVKTPKWSVLNQFTSGNRFLVILYEFVS